MCIRDRLLDALGVKGTRLRLSSLGSPETRAEYREELKAYLRERSGELSAEVRSRIELNPLRAFDTADPGTRAVMAQAPKLLDRLNPEDAEHFQDVRRLLDDAAIRYEIDPGLVRGLDYYTRTLFEFTSDALGAQSGVAGGGRYDRLVEQLGGPPTPACGWAAGVERMLLAADDLPIAPMVVDLFVALTGPEVARDAFTLARQARQAGLAVQLELARRSLKAQLKHADRLGANYVAIVGEPGRATLKQMDSGDQQDMNLDQVIPMILRGSRLA